MPILWGPQMLFLRSLGRWAPDSLPPSVVSLVSAWRVTGPQGQRSSCVFGWCVSKAGGKTKSRGGFGLHWNMAACWGFSLPVEWSRSFSSGKQKCGDTAKEKKMRRMLRRLNYVAQEAQPRENTRGCQTQEQQQPRRGRGGEKDRGDYDSKKTEAEAEAAVAAAQQQMNGHLRNLSSRLKDLDVSRPKITTFEEIQVQVACNLKTLNFLAATCCVCQFLSKVLAHASHSVLWRSTVVMSVSVKHKVAGHNNAVQRRDRSGPGT